MTATQEQIVNKFLGLKYSEWTQANWGLHKDRDYWDIGDTGTYINGVPLIIDYDYRMGYLLELVEHESGAVSYLAIVTDPYGHDSAWFDQEAGTFFSRNVEPVTVMKWAVEVIEGLLEDRQEGAQ